MKDKGKSYSIVLTSVILIFVFFILISNVATAAQVTKIGNGSEPAIYGDKVVWTNGGVIHIYDLANGTDTPVNSSGASYPAIYGNILVWHDESSGTPRLSIYDISTDARSYITQNVDQFSRPAIYGNRIVWSADYNETVYNYNVYMRDISTSTQTRIAYGQDPDVYDTKITYSYDTDEGRRIGVYDISTGEAIQVPYSGDLGSPHIYENKVIWSDTYTRLGYIAMYDLVTKEVTVVTSDSTYSGDPDNPDAGSDTGSHTDIYEDKIVYAKTGTDQFGSAGVYVYSISTGQSTQVANYETGVFTTPDVYDNIVVWGINNFGDEAAKDTGIYMSDLSGTHTLPLEAEFTANVTSGSAPLVVLFTATGINWTSASWLWEFGDGVNSKNAMNATHTFTNPGTYNVNLTVTSESGNVSITKLGYITVTNTTVPDSGIAMADFKSNVTGGYAPLTVQFTDTSQNAVSRIWDFNGDEKADSSELNPVYVYTSPGTYFVNLTIYNSNGFSYKITTISVLENSSSDDSSSSSGGSSKNSGSSGGSGSGGSGGSPEPAKNVEVKEISQAFITNGKPVKFDFAKNATCVVYVSFDAKKTLGKTTTSTEMLKEKSALVSGLPSGEVYKSFNTWVGNGGVATSKNIENPTVCFKVEKSWVEDKNIDPASITLNRYHEEEWEQVAIEPSGKDDEFLYFTAKPHGFSSFAITGTEKTALAQDKPEIQSEPKTAIVDKEGSNQSDTGAKGTGAEQTEISRTPGFEMSLGIACLLGSLFLYKRK